MLAGVRSRLYWRTFFTAPPNPLRGVLIALLAILPLVTEARSQGAPDWSLKLFNPVNSCEGDCYFSFYAGRYLKSEMTNAFGVQKFEPPNRWRYGDSGIVTATVGRPLYAFGKFIRAEVEFGVGKRFGDLTALEGWGAIYFRWLWFPWNDWVRTSIASSTGFSYTPTIDYIERIRNNNDGRGSRLLHFLSPEITFGLPQKPEIDIFLRYHHRSGGRNYVMGKSAIFNSAGGGAQYFVAGVRYHY